MASEYVIPNAVGRLDDVVEAIRIGSNSQAKKLLRQEYERLSRKAIGFHKQASKTLNARTEVWEILQKFENGSHEEIRVLRQACGWDSGEAADREFVPRGSLEFEPIGDGQWEAMSGLGDDRSPFLWKITVLENGRFSIGETEPELCSEPPGTFATFAEAEAYCQVREGLLSDFSGD